MTQLNVDDVGTMCIDAGDFNHVPPAADGYANGFPDVATFSPKVDGFTATLDGFILTHGFLRKFNRGSTQACIHGPQLRDR